MSWNALKHPLIEWFAGRSLVVEVLWYAPPHQTGPYCIIRVILLLTSIKNQPVCGGHINLSAQQFGLSVLNPFPAQIYNLFSWITRERYFIFWHWWLQFKWRHLVFFQNNSAIMRFFFPPALDLHFHYRFRDMLSWRSISKWGRELNIQSILEQLQMKS